MSTQTQSIICRRLTKMDDPAFKHNQLKYKQIGWNTSREQANKGIALSEYDSLSIRVGNDISDVQLYAVWKERDITVIYSDLKLSAADVAYDCTTTPITYQVTRVSTYADISYEAGREMLTNTDVIQASIAEGKNVQDYEQKSSARKLSVAWTHPESGLSASAQFTQGAYIPQYSIKVIDPSWGGKVTVNATAGGTLKVSASDISSKTYTSTGSQFVIRAYPDRSISAVWITNRGCAYYGYSSDGNFIYDYQTRLRHATSMTYTDDGYSTELSDMSPQGRTGDGCGYWTLCCDQNFLLSGWESKDGEIVQKALVSYGVPHLVRVKGKVQSVPEYQPVFKHAPLLSNTVVGPWQETWNEPKVSTYYQTCVSSMWKPTCGVDRNKTDPRTFKHTGWSGHGSWKTVGTYQQAVQKSYVEHHDNIYKGSKHVNANYVLKMPADGVLKIVGKFGTCVYGRSLSAHGNFSILKYMKTRLAGAEEAYQIGYEDFKYFSDTFSNEDKPFSTQFSVKKDELYKITAASGVPDKVGIYIKSITLDRSADTSLSDTSTENPEVADNAFCIEALSVTSEQTTLRDKLLKAFSDGKKEDCSVLVCKAKSMKRDQEHLPKKTYTFTTDKQCVLYINVGGAHGWGYSEALRVKDLRYPSKYLHNEEKQELQSKTCYVYVPAKGRIQIQAVWTLVDTYSFDVWLQLQKVTFDKLPSADADSTSASSAS